MITLSNPLPYSTFYPYPLSQEYTRGLRFDEETDVPRWRRIFQALYEASGFTEADKYFDWEADTVSRKKTLASLKAEGKNPVPITGGPGGVGSRPKSSGGDRKDEAGEDESGAAVVDGDMLDD